MSEVRFGAYRIVETIGQGAVTTLYKAVQEPLGRVVAVKALKTQIAPTSSFGAQIEREAKILAGLAHPNVVLVLDHGRGASGRPYLALEHVDGPSLDALLAKRKRLPVSVAIAIAIGITRALEHAHERDVVHRDVKPGNVLLAKSGVVKLVDFGIAHKTRGEVEGEEHGEVLVTPSGRVTEEPLGDGFGTPAYMSPEQILGDFVDGRSDLFSLGVVLYQMLTGTRPWESTAERTPGKRAGPPLQRRAPPVPLRERAPDVPRAIDRIVMRLLESAPSSRYASAAVLGEKLEAALRGSTREPPPSVIRAALVEAGFVAAVRGRPSSAGVEILPAQPWSLGRVVLGFALVLGLFLASVLLVARPSRAGSARVGSAPESLLATTEGASGGGLRVVASPWAHVRVDGVLVETTPFARPIPLVPGRHWVQLGHPDSPPVEREVEIGEGQIVTIDVTMPVGLSDAGTGRESP